VELVAEHGECRLAVADDGHGGAGRDGVASGTGIANMRQRADALHGQFEISLDDERGTT